MIYFYWLTGLGLSAALAVLLSIMLDIREDKTNEQ